MGLIKLQFFPRKVSLSRSWAWFKTPLFFLLCYLQLNIKQASICYSPWLGFWLSKGLLFILIHIVYLIVIILEIHPGKVSERISFNFYPHDCNQTCVYIEWRVANMLNLWPTEPRYQQQLGYQDDFCCGSVARRSDSGIGQVGSSSSPQAALFQPTASKDANTYYHGMFPSPPDHIDQGHTLHINWLK